MDGRAYVGKNRKGIMRKTSLQIAVAALIMIAVCAIFRFVRGNTIVDVRLNPGLADQVEWGEPPADLTVTYDEEGIVKVEKSGSAAM